MTKEPPLKKGRLLGASLLHRATPSEGPRPKASNEEWSRGIFSGDLLILPKGRDNTGGKKRMALKATHRTVIGKHPKLRWLSLGCVGGAHWAE